MAVMELNKRIVTWKVELKNSVNPTWVDVTHIIGPFVNSIRVRHGVSEGRSLTKKNFRSSSYEINSHSKSKKETAASELDIQMMSNNYIEKYFLTGTKIRVSFKNKRDAWIAYFIGEMRAIPYGGGKDMVNYNVRAYSMAIGLANKEKIRTFKANPLTKETLIKEIAAGAGIIDAIIEISDKSSILKPSDKQYIQKGHTDSEMLDHFASLWRCKWFIDQDSGILYFLDKEKVFDLGLPYVLGYRTDRAKCNVESVDWVQGGALGGSQTEPSAIGFTESGSKLSSHKINYEGQTWERKKEYPAFKIGAKDTWNAFGLTTSMDGELALKQYYQIVPAGNKNPDILTPNSGDNSGIELTIMLNEGDVDLKAPGKAWLYSGVDNLNINTADLPAWIFMYQVGPKNVAVLNIKETVLTYENGILKSELKCSIRTSN